MASGAFQTRATSWLAENGPAKLEPIFRTILYHPPAPLRDHSDDIPSLAGRFTKKYALEMNKHIERIPSDIMRTLVSWTWPGNAGELKSFIERAVVLSRAPNSVLRSANYGTIQWNSPGPDRNKE